MCHEKNLILYGPPGTGKTYSTVIHAVAIIEGEDTIKIKDLPYQDVLSRYNDYKKSGRIAFITFHQNYGYEDFIEGIRPLLDKSEGVDETLTYECHSGIFKDFCRTAEYWFRLQSCRLGHRGLFARRGFRFHTNHCRRCV